MPLPVHRGDCARPDAPCRVREQGPDGLELLSRLGGYGSRSRRCRAATSSVFSGRSAHSPFCPTAKSSTAACAPDRAAEDSRQMTLAGYGHPVGCNPGIESVPAGVSPRSRATRLAAARPDAHRPHMEADPTSRCLLDSGRGSGAGSGVTGRCGDGGGHSGPCPAPGVGPSRSGSPMSIQPAAVSAERTARSISSVSVAARICNHSAPSEPVEGRQAAWAFAVVRCLIGGPVAPLRCTPRAVPLNWDKFNDAWQGLIRRVVLGDTARDDSV